MILKPEYRGSFSLSYLFKSGNLDKYSSAFHLYSYSAVALIAVHLRPSAVATVDGEMESDRYKEQTHNVFPFQVTETTVQDSF